MCLFQNSIEKLAIEEPDLKIAASLEFDIPAADLSDVKQMMDSINAVPGFGRHDGVFMQTQCHYSCQGGLIKSHPLRL